MARNACVTEGSSKLARQERGERYLLWGYRARRKMTRGEQCEAVLSATRKVVWTGDHPVVVLVGCGSCDATCDMRGKGRDVVRERV